VGMFPTQTSLQMQPWWQTLRCTNPWAWHPSHPAMNRGRRVAHTHIGRQVVPAACVVLRPYSAAECTSDAIVHILGVVWGIVASASALLQCRQPGSKHQVPNTSDLSTHLSHPERRHGKRHLLAMLAYAVGIVGMLSCSAAYNIAWSAHHLQMQSVQWWLPAPSPGAVAWLRQIDRTWIYICIAATYTALSTRVPGKASVMTCIWITAVVGVTLKTALAFGHPFLSQAFISVMETLTLLLYIALGWVPVPAMWVVSRVLQPMAKRSIILAGLCYTTGVFFYLSAEMPFHNFIWHVMVLAATMLMYRGVTSEAPAVPAKSVAVSSRRQEGELDSE